MTLKTDARIARTRHALADALVQLTLERGYDSVTIRDVATAAGVGYATFFRHYDSKEALLADVLEATLAQLLPLLQPAYGDAARRGTILFEFVAAHHERCRVLLDRGSGALLDRIYAAGIESALAEQPAFRADVPPAIVANHLVASSIQLIRWWLDHDMPYTPARMGAIQAALIVEPVVGHHKLPESLNTES